MRPFRFPFSPILLALIGVASGALALGASTLFQMSEGSGTSAPPADGLSKPTPSYSAPVVESRPESSTWLSPETYGPGAYATPRRSRIYPALFEPQSQDGPRVCGVDETSGDSLAERAARIPVIANNQIIAFYGKPGSRSMGILGEYSKEDLAKLLEGYAKLYADQSGDEGVVPAFYLIYGTCWPGGEIGYLKDSVVQDYIDFARQRSWLVILDHQIGKYPVAEAVDRLLPWLKYPNVHIALDPEWRTESPMKVIGTVSADEVNAAEQAMSDYLGQAGIPGPKMLILHQFQQKMISDREKVRADYDGVLLIHTADGFGPPALKRSTYAFNAKAANMPLKGFKLFFKTDLEGAGYDDPLLLPADVLALDPPPRLVIYQ
jgi:hypothetical protein